jgi:hypothetical protein
MERARSHARTGPCAPSDCSGVPGHTNGRPASILCNGTEGSGASSRKEFLRYSADVA